MKTLKITGVRTIFATDKPVVVFQTAETIDIVRAPKLALIDLQNSARALKLPKNALDRGLSEMHPAQLEVFVKELKKCVGAELVGDITTYKAGDKYAVRAGHPALTDPKHKDFGKVKKEGDTLVAEKDGVWIEGFLDIAFTEKELFRQEMAEVGATSMLAMFGFSAQPEIKTISQQVEDVEHEDVTSATATTTEAFGPAQTTK